ncbi:MAG: D-glycero-beta-D-manno-heptose-7-phosphate kinase [Candidatus Rokuibacteriota bacterium]
MADGGLPPDEAAALVEALDGHEVVIVGDLMLDRYWWGSVTRLSPEAPVPVVHKQRSTAAPGGAANVAANVASLGGVPRLCGVVGADEAGRELRAELARRGIATDDVVTDPGRPTTVKTRVVAVSQHVVRVDEETSRPVDGALAARLTDRARARLGRAGVLVVSDYAKGVVVEAVLRGLVPEVRRRGGHVVVDPKGHDYSRYRGASIVCPNRSEALAAAGLDGAEPDAVARAGAALLGGEIADAILVTLGDAGMMLFERGRPALAVPALARAVYDVTGAGDTVIAALALTLAARAGHDVAVRLANTAAGLAVEQVGTTAVTAAQLKDALSMPRPSATPVAPTA